MHSRQRRILTASLLFSVLLLGAVFFLKTFSGYFSNLAKIEELKTSYPVVKYHGPKVPFSVQITKNKPSHWVALSQVSSLAVTAIRLSEDWAFFQHKGYDLEQMKSAFTESVEEGRYVRGASTITQQVAKNVLLSQEKSLSRKVQELALAISLERKLGKKRILEIYLNIVEFGEGLFGIGPASRLYFNKDVSQLNARESAFLAMLLPSPKKYSISYRKRELTSFAQSRVKDILQKMKQTQVLSDEEYRAELQRPFPFEKTFVEGEPTELPSLEETEVDAEI